MCERWVGDWTNCNILTPSSFVFGSTSFSFCGAAQSGAQRAHNPLLGAASHYSILYPTNSNCLSHRVISLFDIHLLLVGVTSAPNSTRPQSKLYPDIFDWMHQFLDWRLGRRSICYNSSWVCNTGRVQWMSQTVYKLMTDLWWRLLYSNIWNHLSEQKNSSPFKNVIYKMSSQAYIF